MPPGASLIIIESKSAQWQDCLLCKGIAVSPPPPYPSPKFQFVDKMDILYNIYKEAKVEKILVSLPEDLVKRMKTVIPARKRSQVVKELLEAEIEKREGALFECAKAVESNEALNREMAEWDVTTGDGIEPETW